MSASASSRPHAGTHPAGVTSLKPHVPLVRISAIVSGAERGEERARNHASLGGLRFFSVVSRSRWAISASMALSRIRLIRPILNEGKISCLHRS